MDEDTQLPHKRRAEGLAVVDVSEEEQIRHRIFVKVLQETDASGSIDMQLVRALCFEGLPDVHEIRSKYWKLLLNYLPPQPSAWEQTLADKRALYRSWADELIVNPQNTDAFLGKPPVKAESGAPTVTEPTDVLDTDHPLNTTSHSTWQKFFDNDKIFREIDKDVRRTLPDTDFFIRIHHDQMLRILFLYAKLNPGVKYVQGMNEVLAPIYYLFSNDKDTNNNAHAEADAFWCFTNLMSEIRDHFLAALDRSNHGINFKMQQLYDLLREKDVYLYNHLSKTCQISPQFFAFRWISLLLTQEFELHRVFRLWDAILADVNRFNFLLYLCVAMLVCIRDTLLEGDFTVNLKLLQRYPEIGVNTLVTKALWLHGSMGLPPTSKSAPQPQGGVIETESQARARIGSSRASSQPAASGGGWMSYVSSSVSGAVTSLRAAAEDRMRAQQAAHEPIPWDNPAPVGVGDKPRPNPGPTPATSSYATFFSSAAASLASASSAVTSPRPVRPGTTSRKLSKPTLQQNAPSASPLVSINPAVAKPADLAPQTTDRHASAHASSSTSTTTSTGTTNHDDGNTNGSKTGSNDSKPKQEQTGLDDILAKFAVLDESASPKLVLATASPALDPKPLPAVVVSADGSIVLEDAPL
eukprot:c5789_g1_i1.p1 GENE.c5789_g1_i1~~c5789_g1_i1.p1  ORF type:complete len:639 (+),score=172.00 c5789_g1_i1:37-1953(+)